MARLPEGEQEYRQQRLLRLLKGHAWGLREGEIAQELGWERRTVNNYLHRLARLNQAYREGRYWYDEKLEE